MAKSPKQSKNLIESIRVINNMCREFINKSTPQILLDIRECGPVNKVHLLTGCVLFSSILFRRSYPFLLGTMSYYIMGNIIYPDLFKNEEKNK